MGGGIGMGNTCKPMADSFQCMKKPTTIKKKKKRLRVKPRLPRLVITFLPRSKCLLISWLQSPYTVNLEPPKIKSLTLSIVSPSICHLVLGTTVIS